MSTWAADDLGSLDQIREIGVAGRRPDGSLRNLVTIWQVVVDGKLYIRSVRGADGGWYKGVISHNDGAIAWDGHTRDVAFIPDDTADAAIDAAYVKKYGHNSASESITNATAVATTLRVEPR